MTRRLLALALTAATLPGARALAQSSPAADPLVSMEFPDDGVELSLLADLVTRRLHVPILYDDAIRGKKVVIRVPTKVPESALLGILQSALRLKGMALVDAEQPGWKQVVSAPNLAAVAQPAGDGATTRPAAAGAGPVAQAFIIEHGEATRLLELVRPFLTQPGGSVQADGRVLLVSDYPSVVRRVAQLVAQLDAASPAATKFIALRQAEAGPVATAVTQLIANREAAQGGNANSSGVFLSADERSNQIVVVAPAARMDEVVALIAGMDRSAELQTRVYRLNAVGPERVDGLVRSLLDPASLKRGYQSGIDRDGQALIVSATPGVHDRIAQLVRDLDVPAPQSSNPIQFYKLRNTKAADLLSTINGLLGETGATAPTLAPDATPANAPTADAGRLPRATLGDNASPTPAQRTSADAMADRSPDRSPVAPILGGANASADRPSAGVLSVRNRDATVAADVNTNSIIVIGPPPVQQSYADLIKRLDQRRPQVQIECTIVTLDTTNDISFGVDIGKLGGFDTSQLLTLSSFGISTTDATTGRLTPTNARGGTFALLSPGIADVVIRALQTDNRARLVSAPQLLVNDNGIGKLESVAQEPYAVILDSNSSQSLTSLGGLASAGTSISVEPHISEADYLQLTYSIELSSFTGAAQNGLPPPSQKASVDSAVTIPDGYTIVVGGLSTKNYTAAVNKIPLLGDIPILGYLFGARSQNTRNSTLFVFIRPVILRDDQFEDLKYLSGQAIGVARIDGDFPASEPIPMR